MRWIVSGLLALALLGGVLLLPPAATVGAQAVSATATGDPAVIQILATGFEDNETVSTWLTGPSQQVQASASHETDDGGDVSFRLRIPRHVEPGRWAITVHGLDSGAEAIGSFDVTARGPDLALSVAPTSGPAGTTFAFAATGFDGGEVVSSWLTGPDGATYEGGVVDASGDGAVRFSYAIGAGTQGGTWAMSAYGQASDRLAITTFAVR